MALRDAIVFSGWSWETFNVPERTALALAQLGLKVLYVENPISVFRQKSLGTLREVDDRIFALRPVFLGSRLQAVPLVAAVQANIVARQILTYKNRLGLRNPLFVYPWMGTFWSLPAFMKRRGHFAVRIIMDYEELKEVDRLAIADFTLSCQPCALHDAQERFAGRVCIVSQAIDLAAFNNVAAHPEPKALAAVPRPRLCYVGLANPDRLNVSAVGEIMRRHPLWHFVFFGKNTWPGLPNVHALPWTSRNELPAYVQACDVGFMPYKCKERELHANPLKLLDYFALGKPVVATPIIHLWQYEDLVYRGHSVEQLEGAIFAALAEPINSPKRQRRMEIAKEHSIEKLAEVLRKVLPLDA